MVFLFLQAVNLEILSTTIPCNTRRALGTCIRYDDGRFAVISKRMDAPVYRKTQYRGLSMSQYLTQAYISENFNELIANDCQIVKSDRKR